MSDKIKDAKDRLEKARKKLDSNAGAEAEYAAAYAALCQLDPTTYRPLRRKYR